MMFYLVLSQGLLFSHMSQLLWCKGLSDPQRSSAFLSVPSCCDCIWQQTALCISVGFRQRGIELGIVCSCFLVCSLISEVAPYFPQHSSTFFKGNPDRKLLTPTWEVLHCCIVVWRYWESEEQWPVSTGVKFSCRSKHIIEMTHDGLMGHGHPPWQISAGWCRPSSTSSVLSSNCLCNPEDRELVHYVSFWCPRNVLFSCAKWLVLLFSLSRWV